MFALLKKCTSKNGLKHIKYSYTSRNSRRQPQFEDAVVVFQFPYAEQPCEKRYHPQKRLNARGDGRESFFSSLGSARGAAGDQEEEIKPTPRFLRSGLSENSILIKNHSSSCENNYQNFCFLNLATKFG